MAVRERDIGTKIAGWLGLSLPPFHTVGILPFILGTVLAWRLDSSFNSRVFALSSLGVVLVMLSTYHAGEYFIARRKISVQGISFGSRLAGERRPIRTESLPRSRRPVDQRHHDRPGRDHRPHPAIRIAYRPADPPAGLLGALPGFFYSTRLIRLFEKGFGELFIGFCYGWLPLAAAFYIQRGYIAPCIHWMALPIGLSIFNVILLNEFPDYPADAAAGKTNLLVRLGKDKGMSIYVLVSILSWFCMYFLLQRGIPRKALYFYLPGDGPVGGDFPDDGQKEIRKSPSPGVALRTQHRRQSRNDGGLYAGISLILRSVPSNGRSRTLLHEEIELPSLLQASRQHLRLIAAAAEEIDPPRPLDHAARILADDEPGEGDPGFHVAFPVEVRFPRPHEGQRPARERPRHRSQWSGPPSGSRRASRRALRSPRGKK